MKREKDGANRAKQPCCSMNTSVCHISISFDRAVVSPQAIIYRHRLGFIKLLLRELFCSRCTGAVVGCHLVKTDGAPESVSGAERGEQLLRSEVDVQAILTNTKMEPGRRTKAPLRLNNRERDVRRTGCERVLSQEVHPSPERRRHVFVSGDLAAPITVCGPHLGDDGALFCRRWRFPHPFVSRTN